MTQNRNKQYVPGKGHKPTGKKARPHPGIEGMTYSIGDEGGDGATDHAMEVIHRGEHLQDNLVKSWWPPKMANSYKRWFWQHSSFMGVTITPWLAANWDSWISATPYGRAMRMFSEIAKEDRGDEREARRGGYLQRAMEGSRRRQEEDAGGDAQ